jgi:hypothetical protein
MAEKLSLGGREYVHAGVGPLRQDLFLMAQARHAGLTDAALRDGEAPEEFAARLLDSCITSGRALLLLGGMLLPAGSKPEDWTEEMAHATAAHLGSVTEQADKVKVQAELVSALLGFFENGLASWIASTRSSPAGEPGRKGESGGTASGTASSENSPATTPIGAAPSAGGC